MTEEERIERKRENYRRYRARNREKLNEKARLRSATPDVRAKRAESYRRWYAKNREYCLERARIYRADHIEKYRERDRQRSPRILTAEQKARVNERARARLRIETIEARQKRLEKARQWKTSWKAKNIEHVRKYARSWWAANIERNREYAREYAREYTKRHLERRRAYWREYHRNWLQANRERARENSKRWKAKNPDKVREIQRRYRLSHRLHCLEIKQKWLLNNEERARETKLIYDVKKQAAVEFLRSVGIRVSKKEAFAALAYARRTGLLPPKPAPP